MAEEFVVEAPKVDRRKRIEVPGVGVLRAMRFVFRNEEKFDRTGEERAMRAYLQKKPSEFLADLESREKAEVSDDGGDDVERMIARLLREGLGHE
jgi:hypothetical protein